MPSNAELAKRLEKLEKVFRATLDDMAEKVTNAVVSKFDAEPSLVVNDLKKEIEELKTSLSFLNDTVEALKAENEGLKQKNKTLKKKLKEKNNALKAQNDNLEKRLADMEQHSRKNNLEIKGVPCSQGEDCMSILQTIGSKIDCPITADDVDVVHRVPAGKKSDTKNLIARFYSRSKKTEFISKARKARLCVRDLGFSSSDTASIYVNDHLTAQNKLLFAKAKQLKKDNGWEFLWTKDCVILARQTHVSTVFRIQNESDLRVFE